MQYFTRAVRTVQVGAALFFFAGEQLFGKLGRRPPALYDQMHENKLVAAGAIYGLDVIAQTAKSINAFEITYNGVLLHSKLATGQFPKAEEVAQKLAEVMMKDGAKKATEEGAAAEAKSEL